MLVRDLLSLLTLIAFWRHQTMRQPHGQPHAHRMLGMQRSVWIPTRLGLGATQRANIGQYLCVDTQGKPLGVVKAPLSEMANIRADDAHRVSGPMDHGWGPETIPRANHCGPWRTTISLPCPASCMSGL
ncbi:hypothetical protein QBC37DRAFT_7204 [Rhypophila decipiens]|uniref:Uncharacterized protein n=1 Tax=Rhypophila decipiens TaxID=261697 RepID=A0AAN7BBZ5_9PEZI|nr:hypothetical protein QBC37DRAFT_7204 [Rhypophila decipiens]